MSDITATLAAPEPSEPSANSKHANAVRLEALRDTVKTMPADPGVYRMPDATGAVL